MRPKERTIWTIGLHKLVQLLPDRCIMVEVGCYAGESTIFFLEKAERIFCVDMWEPYDEITADGLKHLDASEAEASFDALSLANKGRIVKIKKHSARACGTVERQSVDAVYLDAGHDYSSVTYDIVLWLPKVKTGGILAGHDYGNAFHTGVKRSVDEAFGEPNMLFEDTSWMIIKK